MGYFNNETRGSASIEMRPVPGMTPEQSLDFYYETFCEAWEIAITNLSGVEDGKEGSWIR
jgi:hypothetical protein